MSIPQLPFLPTLATGRVELGAEPFRVMFPAAVLAGLLGVALWPLWAWDALPFYPGLSHARVMTGGFFGAMIIGFLGTAGPRMLGARPLAAWELATLFALWAAGVVAALRNSVALADGLACAVFLFGFRCAGARFLARETLPPPGFAMAAMGLLAGFAGAALNLAVGLGLEWLPAPPALYALGKLLFYQAFVLLPILGIAPFFFPRFGGLPNAQAAFPDARRPARAWLGNAAFAASCGALLIASFVLEAFGWPRMGGLGRFAVATFFALRQIPLRFPADKVGTLGRVARMAVVLMLLGLLLPVLFPAYRIGLLHLLFIGGFNLIALAVANWVIFGHGGVGPRARGRLVYVRWTAAILLFALATRVVAEFIPTIRESHLVYAAVAWIAGMLVWAWSVLPRVATADAE